MELLIALLYWMNPIHLHVHQRDFGLHMHPSVVRCTRMHHVTALDRSHTHRNLLPENKGLSADYLLGYEKLIGHVAMESHFENVKKEKCPKVSHSICIKTPQGQEYTARKNSFV